MSPVSLEQVRDDAAGESFPRSVLERCESALVLFAAGFHGSQDAFWVAAAGLSATCVDQRPGNLGEMAAVYPDSWEFVRADAFEFAESTDETWDLVSVDCPTGAFDRCADLVGLWCSLARVAVVLGTGFATSVSPPEGWQVTDVRQRSVFAGGVFWTVLERE